MRTIFSIAFILLVGLTLLASSHAEEARCKYYFLHGEPSGMRDYNVLFKDMYAISVDDKTKAVNWVSYCLDGKLAAAYENNPDGRSAPWLGEVVAPQGGTLKVGQGPIRNKGD